MFNTRTDITARTINARQYANRELVTSIIGTRLSHHTINGASVWYIATPQGTFRTTTGAGKQYALNTLTGPALIKIDGRGTIWDIQTIERDTAKVYGHANSGTYEASAYAANVQHLYEYATSKRATVDELARRVYADNPQHWDDRDDFAQVNWQDVLSHSRQD